MVDFGHWLIDPFAHAFMRRALLEVVMMGAVTGAIGTYVVLRGLSFIGDALSHAIFPGVVIAFLLGRSVFLGALVFGLLTSGGIVVLATTRRIREDSAIGVLFAGTFALGVVLISTTRNFSRDLASFLFGNVLGVTTEDIWLSALVGGTVVLLLALFHKELLLTAFDRVAAQAMGVPVFWLDLLLLVLISLTIVVSLSAVGNILVVAMLVTPAAAARLLTDRVTAMIGLSAAIGVVAGALGLLISYHADVAAGGTIVLVATALFGLVWLFAPAHGALAALRRRHRAPLGVAPESQVVFESPEIRTTQP
ncbi:MAG: anchored repeat-type ABC transporter permease subunit [Candidatus Rokuibacteriota bacterium]|nr:MAG: anchored repeat-type ABC transporter permease subunit [Candidatus Rokubacteria bacterium]